MTSVHKGQTVHLSVAFTVSGTATDPTTVTLRIQTPAGVDTPYTWAGGTVTKDATGVFSKDIVASESGVWVYRWEGTGAVSATDEDRFFVQASEF